MTCGRCGSSDVTTESEWFGMLCSPCAQQIFCDAYDDDELGVDPEAKWYDPERDGFLIGPGELPPLPRLPNA